MKKILFFALMLLCSTTVVGQVIPSVSTVEQLKAEVERNSSFKLGADIDVSGVGKLAETFSATIFGEGHAITGVTIPLFDTVAGATFRDITFKDCSIKTEENFHCGIIACEAIEGCKFENVSIQNSLVNSNTKPEFTNEEYGKYNLALGCLVGTSDRSTFTGCSVDDQTGVYSEMTFIELYNYTYVGGLVGYSTNDTYQNCINNGMVSGSDYAGGLVGWAEKAQISSCINAGTIIGKTDVFEDQYFAKHKAKEYETSKVVYDGQSYTVQTLNEEDFSEFIKGFLGASIGGLFGYIGDNSVMTNCANLSGHTAGAPIGGLVGKCSASVIDRCYNYGSSRLSTRFGDDNKGGIVGKITDGSTVSNCFNAGSLRFDNDSYGYGSIAGSTSVSCKIFNCISTTACTIISYHNKISLDANNSGNNYFLKPNVEYNEYSWERGVTEEQFKIGLVAYWMQQTEKSNIWKGESSPWRQNIGEDDYPVLDSTHKIVTISDVQMPTISNYQDLYDFYRKVDLGDIYAMGRLACDIDMYGNSLIVGSTENPFCGVFDGAGHTINNSDYRPTNDGGGVGIFGTVGNYGEIHNLILGEDCTVMNTDNEDGAAGIVGQVVGNGKPGYVIIDGCGNRGVVNAGSYAGGILGKVDCNEEIKVAVTNCFNVGEIKTTNGNSALLCGYTKDNAIVTNCWSAGKLTSENQGITPFAIVGEEHRHFVGYDNTLNMSNCYSFVSDTNVTNWQRSKCQSGVTDYPTTQMLTSGTFTYLLNGQKNDPETNTWQQNMGDYPVPGNKGLYHTREVTSQYGTVCLPYALKSDNEIQYYTFTSVETGESSVTLHFEAAEEVGASCPALFSVKTTGTYSFEDAHKDYSFGTYNTDNTEWRLLGTFEQKEFSGTDAQGIYYLAGGQFCNTSTATIPAFTAYLLGPDISSLEGKPITFVMGGVDAPATVITLPMSPAPLGEGRGGASVMGTKVGNGYRGIVIQNGRKVVRK